MALEKLKQHLIDWAAAGADATNTAPRWNPTSGNLEFGPPAAASGGSVAAGVFDANAAPYSCVAGDSAHDNSAALQQAITDAINWAKTNTGVAVVELDDGEYYLTRAPQTTGGCYAQVPITPRVATTDQRVTLVIRGKQHSRALPKPFFGPTKGGVVFRSTLTGQTYSVANGWPAMFGGPDAVHGTTITSQASWMTLHFQGVGFRQPADPSLAAVNAQMIDERIFEDCRWDTLAMDTTGHIPSAPTHPTGVADLPPINALDGNSWRGVNFCTGHYAGPSIGELMDNTGTIYSYENYVAANLVAPWNHLADIGFFFDVRCAYGFAQVDGTAGIVAVPNGLPSTNKTFLRGTYDVEDKTSGWNARIEHVHDPNNQLGGRLGYLRVVANVGNQTGALILSGASGITFDDITTAPASGTGGSLTVKEEGVSVATGVTQLNFVGANVTATAGTAGQVDVTVTGSSTSSTYREALMASGSSFPAENLASSGGDWLYGEAP